MTVNHDFLLQSVKRSPMPSASGLTEPRCETAMIATESGSVTYILLTPLSFILWLGGASCTT